MIPQNVSDYPPTPTPVHAPVEIGTYTNTNSGITSTVYSIGGAGQATVQSQNGVVQSIGRRLNNSGVTTY